MKRTLVAALTLSLLGSGSLRAGEDDFVGYAFSQDTKRDYDRGFFFGADAWGVDARDINFEPAILSVGAPAPVGGTLVEVDFDFEVTPRVFLGYQANRRVGRFTLRYWDVNKEANTTLVGAGAFFATGAHPLRGGVNNGLVGDSMVASALADVELAELEWRKDFGQGRKFTGYWTIALEAFEIEFSTESVFFFEVAPSQAIRIADFTDTKGFGAKMGVGGTFQFNDRFSLGGFLGIGYSSTDLDYTYVDENTDRTKLGFIRRDGSEVTSLLFEGDLNFHLRLGAGFSADWGYRYLKFEDVIAEDRFVDSRSTSQVVEQTHGIAFEGPYIGLRWMSGFAKIDSDGDGVLDVYDDCQDTPPGAAVQSNGCPRDSDEDGIYDGIDLCPGTKLGTRVDEFGCGLDSDGDGVADGLDLCPASPDCAIVDSRGCPKDSDGDGVPNGCDACPSTIAGQSVGPNGCASGLPVEPAPMGVPEPAAPPMGYDSDGDTVPDERDACPGTERGAVVDANGCVQLVSMVLQFESNSARLSPSSLAQLQRIAQALLGHGGSFEVAGHADSRAGVEYNQALSERRSQAVVDQLVAFGVPAERLTAVGYSELHPIADNATEEGRAANRRVEIIQR